MLTGSHPSAAISRNCSAVSGVPWIPRFEKRDENVVGAERTLRTVSRREMKKIPVRGWRYAAASLRSAA